MATFGGLFDFPDLSDGQLELSSPPDLSDDEYSEYTEDEEDAWYNLPSDLDDEDDDSITPASALPVASPTAVLSIIGPKEHSTGALRRDSGVSLLCPKSIPHS
jgi:hypothetical protein